MGWLSSLGSALTGGVSNLFSGSHAAADFLDPANLFHEGKAERTANAQWQYEYQLQKQNFEEAKAQNVWNRSMQEKSFEYQKALNQLQMEREDTATQRRVADLKAAGLSPTLAAGSAADTGSLHAGSVSQVAPAQAVPASSVKAQAAMFKEQMMKDQLQLATTLMGNFADISRTKAETELINAQTNQLNAWTPIDLKLKSQLYEFNEAYNPYRIEDIISKIENTRGDTFYKERQGFLVDAQKLLAMDEHGMNAYRQAGIILDNSLKRANIDLKNQEYIKEAIAIEMLRSQYQEYEYAREFFHDRFSGAPAGFSLPTIYQSLPNQINNVAGGIASALENGWNVSRDFVSRTVEKAGNFLDSIGLRGLLTRITGGAFDYSR